MFNLSPIYSARKSSNHKLSINHKISSDTNYNEGRPHAGDWIEISNLEVREALQWGGLVLFSSIVYEDLISMPA